MLAVATSEDDSTPSPPRWLMFCVAASAVAFVLEKIRVLYGIGVRYTSGDQTIYWYVAQDYRHGRFVEPLFYGSPYSSHLESLLAVPLLWLHVPLRLCIPIVTGLLTSAPWMLIALAAFKRRHYHLTITILCAQLLLPVEYGGIATQAAQATGASVAGIVAALLLFRQSPATYAAFGLFGSLAVFLYPNSVFMVGPAAAYTLLTRYRDPRLWCWMLPGAALGTLLYVLTQRFYAQHPAYVIHVQWGLSWSWDSFVDGLRHLDRHIADLIPQGVSAGAFLMAYVAGLIVLTRRTANWQLAVSSALLLIGLLASLGISKVHDGTSSITFAYSRAFYSFPLAIAWLSVLWLDSVPASQSLTVKRAGFVLLGALAVLGVRREIVLSAELKRLVSVPSVEVLEATDEVMSECRTLRARAQALGADLVLFVGDRADIYACSAKWYGTLDALFTPFDRRTLNMLEERDRTRKGILISDAPAKVCQRARAHGLACEIVGDAPRLAFIREPGVSALVVASFIGLEVRHL